MEAVPKHSLIVSYRTYFFVWLALIALTSVLVLVSELFHGTLSVWAMLVLTPVKAGLIFFFFMHLKYERTGLKALVFMTLGLLVMVIALFFLDISYR
jgi:cytochrome c oxidase subunit 4